SSLRTKMTVSGMIAMIIPVVLVAVIGLSMIARAERNFWETRQAEAAHNATFRVTQFLHITRVEIDHMGEAQTVLGRDKAALDEHIGHVDQILEVVVVDAAGKLVEFTTKDAPVLANLFTIPQSRWFVESLSAPEGQMYMTEPLFSAGSAPYQIISMPTADGGVIAARVSLDEFGDVVADATFGETGAAYVVESEGPITAHTNPDMVAAGTNLAGRTELEHVLASPTGSWTGQYTNFQGNQVIGTASVIPDTDLVVFTEVHRTEAYNLSRISILLLVGVPIIGWVIQVLAMVFTTNRVIFYPLKRLLTGAKEVEQGNLSYQAPVTSTDEFGEVTTAFNTMVSRLKARTDEREGMIKELLAAKRIAEENSRLKSEFLSTMSHELRTPMNAIEGFTSIMLARMGGVQFNEKAERYITRVNANSKRLLQLINDFLDLSRVEAGRLELAHLPFAPRAMASRWQEEIGVLAEKKGLRFDITIDPELPANLVGDEEAISKVALNLLGNAIKFTEEGSITLALEWTNHEWRISVQDTGIGIPRHAREFIFDEFRQVDQTSKRKFGGTGLGLAIVQKYVRSMGGTVSVKSDVGQGSIFTVSLPLDVAPVVVETPAGAGVMEAQA
ncbi:MAG: HAMP domain-containing protein, partial [Anaerolineae bacterium]|nr:HAMP domain-containing protein [Anaerolineae bacterium]